MLATSWTSTHCPTTTSTALHMCSRTETSHKARSALRGSARHSVSHGYWYCVESVSLCVSVRLSVSLSNHDLYCLAYVFTYRDFSQGTLGLAWVGSSLSKSQLLILYWVCRSACVCPSVCLAVRAKTEKPPISKLCTGSHASLKVLEFFSPKFKSRKYLKTGQVLESPWISFHRSLKVLEFSRSDCAISATSLNRCFA